MDCTYYFTLMSEALDGELRPRQRRKLDEHLAQCSYCAAHFQTLAIQSQALRLLDCEVPEELFPQIINHLPPQEPPHSRPAPHVPRRVLRWAALAVCIGLTIFSLSSLPPWSGSRVSPLDSSALQTETGIASPAAHVAVSNAPHSATAAQSQDAVPSPKSAAPDVDASSASAERGISGPSEAGESQYYEFHNPQYLWLDNSAFSGAEILGSRDSLLAFLSQFPQNEAHLTAFTSHYDASFFQTHRLLAVVTEPANSIGSYTLDPHGLFRSQVTLLGADVGATARSGISCLIIAEVAPPFEDGDVLDIILP